MTFTNSTVLFGPAVGLIGALTGYLTGKHNRKTSKEIAEKTEESEDRREFFNKVYNGWSKLNEVVDGLREENLRLLTKVTRLEQAETRLTQQIGGLEYANATLEAAIAVAKNEAQVATERAASAELKAEEERKLFDKQRRAWIDWGKKVLLFIKESGRTVPPELENPPMDMYS